MNPYAHVEKHFEMEAEVQATRTETDILAQSGFTAEEIGALVWLQKWYQTGGSDRFQIVSHLESLKLLVLNGKMEV